MLRGFMFRRVAIIGVGMMGGSLGLALKKYQLAKEVVGFSPKEESLEAAKGVGAIDVGETDIGKAVRQSDLVILAAPVDSIIKLMKSINPFLKRGCLVTDVGSTKAQILEASSVMLQQPAFFVGSHPLAGSEKQGVMNASAALFEGALCVVTPTETTHPTALRRVITMWNKIGAQVKELSPQRHDEILGAVSHLPHVLAFGIISSIPDEFFECSPQSLKDLTRVAGSSPQMWNDICLSNSRHIIQALDAVIKELATLRLAIVQKDSPKLIDYFSKARDKRSKL
jgi:prephenate dehydrogenase